VHVLDDILSVVWKYPVSISITKLVSLHHLHVRCINEHMIGVWLRFSFFLDAVSPAVLV